MGDGRAAAAHERHESAGEGLGRIDVAYQPLDLAFVFELRRGVGGCHRQGDDG